MSETMAEDDRGDGMDGPPGELPPVEPPTAGFILQLFLIPAIIVAVLIVVVALFGKLGEGRRDPREYVETIRSGNENVRWRAAYELASLIQNDEALASDPGLVGELTGLLAEELDRPGDDPRIAQFLAASLGAFQTLEATTPRGRAHDPLDTLASALARSRPMPVRMAAAESLARQAARRERTPGDPLDDPDAVGALVEAANDPDAELRQRAAFALGFCGGPTAVGALQKVVATDGDRIVRYNAANALARRGDPAALPTLREMFSPADLAEAVRTPTASETRRRVEEIQVEGLRALDASTRSGHPNLATRLRPEVEALRRSDLPAVRMEAEALLKTLQSSR